MSATSSAAWFRSAAMRCAVSRTRRSCLRWIPRRKRGCSSDLGAVDGVARVTKIADADEAAGSPVQQHEVGRRSRGIAGIAYQNRRSSVDESRNQQPIVHQRVVAEISADLALAIQTSLVD